MDVLTFVIAAIIFILISFFINKDRSKKFLPGPTGLPIVGYIPFMTRKPYEKLSELSKRYGPLYQVRLGTRNVVVICDFKIMKEAFQQDVFIGRPKELPFELSETTMRTGAMLGVPWKEQRRFSLHMLRDLGLGKTRMEEHIKEEILEVIERLSSAVNTQVRMSDILAPSMSNNVASFIFGKRLKYNDPRRQRLDFLFGEIGKLAGSLSWQIFFPWISKFTKTFNIGARGKFLKYLEEVKQYCLAETKEHEKTLDPNNIRDFMDGYLLEIEKRANDPNSAFHKDVLADISRAFFGAGSETVRITVDWTLLICAAHPDVQERIQAEIDEVIGQEGFPNGQNRVQMPFTEAVILETMRWKTIVPMNLLRCNIEDTELNGFFIPKNSPIISNLWHLDHEESLWGTDAHEFKPERFLTEDAKKVVKPEHFIPFSIGKRSCPGKPLAEIEVFLYVVAILQKFKISFPPGKVADFVGVLGIGLQPKRQELILEFRNK